MVTILSLLVYIHSNGQNSKHKLSNPELIKALIGDSAKNPNEGLMGRIYIGKLSPEELALYHGNYNPETFTEEGLVYLKAQALRDKYMLYFKTFVSAIFLIVFISTFVQILKDKSNILFKIFKIHSLAEIKTILPSISLGALRLNLLVSISVIFITFHILFTNHFAFGISFYYINDIMNLIVITAGSILAFVLFWVFVSAFNWVKMGYNNSNK